MTTLKRRVLLAVLSASQVKSDKKQQKKAAANYTVSQ